MKTIILFMSAHGCTIKIAHQIAGELDGEVHLQNLKDHRPVDLNEYDRVVIGGSIHAGRIQRRVTQFCEQNLDELLRKEIGLFICCMYEGEKATEQLRDAFPETLRAHAKAAAIAGGELILDKMNLFERFVVKQVANVTADVRKIDKQALRTFTQALNKRLQTNE